MNIVNPNPILDNTGNTFLVKDNYILVNSHFLY
jgi:hypothetical protein